MPTARELLEQADALMRRNRKHGKGRLGDVPTLTDALDADRDTSLAPTLVLPDAQTANADPVVLDTSDDNDSAMPDDVIAVDPMSLDTLGDVPVLTDAVLDWPPGVASLPEPADARVPVDVDRTEPSGDAFPASAEEAAVAAAELPAPAVLEQESSARRTDEGVGDDAGRGDEEVPDSDTAAPPGFLDGDFILEIPPPDEAAAPAASGQPSPIPTLAAPATLTPGSGEWDALAEEIRMQVLQRLDLFTDTGLRDQLGARLAPIVERASDQLVETINREIGELVRGYVAEAIEREIDTWRKHSA